MLDTCGVCGGDGTTCDACAATTIQKRRNGAYVNFNLGAGAHKDEVVFPDGTYYGYSFPGPCQRVYWNNVRIQCLDVRRGIVQVLSEHPDAQIVAEASDYGQLRAELKKHGEPDVLVMDVGLPGKNGIEILKSLREEYPRLKVLMVSMYPEDQYAVRAFKAGAFGYLNKGSAPDKLLEALSMVIAGKKYVTPEIAQALIENLNAPEDTVAPHEKLSDREFQTLRLMASGKRLSDIAEELALSPKTVSVYRARILEKMGMSNNAELTHYAIKHGLVE